jgi:hypothetical protein
MTALGHYNLTASDGTVPQYDLGTEINIRGATYGYFKAAGDIAAYALCTVAADGAGEAAEGTTTTAGSGPVGVCIPQFAVADNEYFWAPVGPFRKREDSTTTFKVLAANCAAGAKCQTTATDGVVDDASTTVVSGLALTETVTTQEAADCVAVGRLGCNL